MSYYNEDTHDPFLSFSDLRSTFTKHWPKGDQYLDYLLDGEYFEGKEAWVNDDEHIKKIYQEIINDNPYLQTESPYSPFFRKTNMRTRGDNEIVVSSLSNASTEIINSVRNHKQLVADGKINPVVVLSGGPAPKIASILLALNSEYKNLDVKFLIDGAEQSNESGSASYEHIHHANALNAEHDNTGHGILFTALKRAIWGERNPELALDTDYRKVDLWPKAIRLRDFPIYFYNEFHGLLQMLKRSLGMQTDHDKSRYASKVSTHVLSYIEEKTGTSLRLPYEISRALFVYFNKKQHDMSVDEAKLLAKSIEIYPRKLDRDEIANFYGSTTLKNVTSVDIFYENFCIKHGFDKVCRSIIEQLGKSYHERVRIKEIYLDGKTASNSTTSAVACGLTVENVLTSQTEFIPLDYLGLSLGQSATYRYTHSQRNWVNKLQDKFSLSQPVPYQTIATGFSGQILFKITNKDKFKILPYTGLKQTHFVEIGRSQDFILVRLTSGGNIGLPTYSRSYAISAISNMLRILTPDCGLEFYSVVSAYPCIRAVNATNNGEISKIADNFAVRFGEGGTGMSKMGSNAQVILDMVGLSHGLPSEMVIPLDIYKHTVIDNRQRTVKCLNLKTNIDKRID